MPSSASAPVRYGIIGTGMIARFHAQAIAAVPNAKLTAVYDKVPERAKAFADEHGVAWESDLDAFLARTDVDAVTVTTPSGARVEVAVPAARAGKHVLCEKPIEVTPARADRIINACALNEVVLGCVFQARTWTNVKRIKAAVEAGRFGRLVMADVQLPWYRSQEYYNSAEWRGTWRLDGGGALMNQSIHIIDLLVHFCGRPAAACAFTDVLAHTDIQVEDAAAAAVRFESGCLATITATTACNPGFTRRLELCGETGSVVLVNDRLERWSFVDQTEEDDRILAEGQHGEEEQSGGAGDPKAISFEGHRRQIEDLTAAILEGRGPIIPGTEGRRAVELICGIYESARSHRPYLFPEDDGPGARTASAIAML
jgi:predicted dehydrogenase